MEKEPKKVFISYAWEDEEHKQWVRELATRLRNHRVDVILDQWEARIGDDLQLYMEQGLTDSHLILCICSDQYIAKANSGLGGVGYEKRILTDEMINSTNKRFIIPIIRGCKQEKKVPFFLSGIRYLDFEDNGSYKANYWELLRRIYDKDTEEKPPLGSNPFDSSKLSEQITTALEIGKIEFQNTAFEGKVSFDYKTNNGLFLIGEGEFQFTTSWSGCGPNSVYCYSDYIKRVGYNSSYQDFPSIDKATDFNFSSRAWAVHEGEIVIIENQRQKFAAVKVTRVIRKDESIGHLLELEYKIYTDID